MSLLSPMDDTHLATDPAADQLEVEEPLDPKARRAMPLVWMVLGAVAVAMMIGWFLLQAVPPAGRASSLLAVPGQPTPADATAAGVPRGPQLRSPYTHPGGRTT